MFSFWRERLRDRWFGGQRVIFDRVDSASLLSGCYRYRSGYENYRWRVHLRCFVMNIIDFRYWRCPCAYIPPYGRVISADCAKHD